MAHPPVALRAFPPLSQRCALRAGGRSQRGGAALAREPWPRPCRCHALRATPTRNGSLLSARGFTLIELLVAIAILGLVAILSWRGLDSMVRTQTHTRERSEQLLTLQAALGQWSADLDALLPLAHTVPIDWDGQVLRLTRRSPVDAGEGALVVAWARRNVQGQDLWLRWQSAPLRTRGAWSQAWLQAAQWARNPGDADRRNEVAILPLSDWRVFYYRGDAWSNPLSSPGTPPADLSAVGALIPDGVRLQLDLPGGAALGGTLVRDWANPLRGGGKS